MIFFNYLVIIIATGLTQYHGIHFWSGFVGIESGWAWSISLEVAALWLWFNTGRRRLLAFIASCLLLAGPLFHIIQPALLQLEQNETAKRNQLVNQVRIKEKINQIENALAVSLKNSQRRQGWLGDIEAGKNNLNLAHAELSASLANPVISSGPWPWLMSLMQAFALLIVWAVSVLAISDLTKHKGTSEKNRKFIKQAVSIDSKQDAKQSNTTEPSIEKIIEALNFELSSKKITQNAWAELNGLSKKNVSLVKNHIQRKRDNKETAGRDVIAKMAKALGLIPDNTLGDN